MKVCLETTSDEVVGPFKKTPEGQLLVGELELLRLLENAEGGRVIPDDGERSVIDSKRTCRQP